MCKHERLAKIDTFWRCRDCGEIFKVKPEVKPAEAPKEKAPAKKPAAKKGAK